LRVHELTASAADFGSYLRHGHAQWRISDSCRAHNRRGANAIAINRLTSGRAYEPRLRASAADAKRGLGLVRVWGL
jgi:hypothetical protein